MSTVVLDAIAEATATLERAVPVPTEPLGYGVDLSCVEDITETLEEVDPFSRLGIGQALVRRLSTPRGALQDDQDYGLDLRGFLNRGTTPGELPELEGKIHNEVTKDDRVDAVDVTATHVGVLLLVEMRITPVDPAIGGFSLVLAVSAAAVLIEALS